MKRTVLLLLIATLAVMVSIPAFANGTAASEQQGAVTSESEMGATTGTTTGEMGAAPSATAPSTTMAQPSAALPGTVAQACPPGMVGQAGVTGQPVASAQLPVMVGGTAIAIQNQDVYIVSGNMLFKFDRNLNLKQQAVLPFAGGTALAMAPYTYGTYGQYAPYGMYGQPAQFGYSQYGQPMYCVPGPVAAAPIQPGVAGFREQPMPAPRWAATLNNAAFQTRSGATGTGQFWLSNNGQTLNYRLDLSNARNVTGAFLQLMQPGVAMTQAPMVATLFSPRRATGAVNGRLVSGSITARDLSGPFSGQPLSALVSAINQGQVVVAIRTTNNPNGEIGGALMASP